MTVKPIPEGYHSVTPYLTIDGAAKALDFYKKAFNALEKFQMPTPDGKIGHAEIIIGNSTIMMADPCEESPTPSPQELGGSSMALYLYVDDVDTLFAQAIKAGATEIKPLKDEFYGDRIGAIKDPYGHIWYLATHKEDLTPEEIDERAKKLFS